MTKEIDMETMQNKTGYVAPPKRSRWQRWRNPFVVASVFTSVVGEMAAFLFEEFIVWLDAYDDDWADEFRRGTIMRTTAHLTPLRAEGLR